MWCSWCCWGPIAKEIGEWLQIGKVAKFYELVGLVYGLLGLGVLVCGVTAWVKVFGGDLE